MNKLFTLACILVAYIAQSKTTGITIPTLYPHFGSSQPNINGMGGTPVRLISKVTTIYDGTKYIPFDSATYTYSNGRGGILDLDYTDNFLNFDTCVYYDFDKATNTYQNSLRYTQQFHSNNNIQYRIQEQWINNQVQWHKNVRHEYVYNPGFTRLEQTNIASWNGSWQGNSVSYTLIYNGKNDIIEIQYVLSNTKLSYDVNHNVIERTEYSHINGNYTDKFIFSYDASDNLASYIYQKFVDGNWVDALKKDYTYAGDNLTSTAEYSWKNNAWQAERQNLFTYDGKNNKLSDEYQQWDAASNSFINLRKEEWTYNAQNQPLTYKSLTWNPASQNWQPVANDFLYHYEYEFYNPTFVNRIPDVTDLFTVYPQPANDVVNINFKNTASAKYDGCIYDIKGKIIKSFEVNADKNSVPLNDLPSGNYMISLSHKGKKIAQTLVVTR